MKQKSETIKSDRLYHKKKKKVYYLDRKRNKHGDFIKITEAIDGKRDTIVIPDELVEPFVEKVSKLKGNKTENESSRTNNQSDRRNPEGSERSES